MRIGNSFRKLHLVLGLAAVCTWNFAAYAQERTCMIDWKQLNLNADQSKQIQVYESQWTQDYNQIKPVITEEQRKLQRMLESHNPDAIEVMALQQSIARKKEQLNQAATANYLKKRQVLTEHQQHQLEQMIRQRIQEKQKEMHPGAQTEVVPDRIQDIMQKVRNIWPSKGN